MRETTFQYDLVFLAERVGFSFGLEFQPELGQVWLVLFQDKMNKESQVRFSAALRKKYRELFKKKLVIQNGVPQARDFELRNNECFFCES